jgi:hypothetical protein
MMLRLYTLVNLMSAISLMEEVYSFRGRSDTMDSGKTQKGAVMVDLYCHISMSN